MHNKQLLCIMQKISLVICIMQYKRPPVSRRSPPPPLNSSWKLDDVSKVIVPHLACLIHCVEFRTLSEPVDSGAKRCWQRRWRSQAKFSASREEETHSPLPPSVPLSPTSLLGPQQKRTAHSALCTHASLDKCWQELAESEENSAFTSSIHRIPGTKLLT